ncbi:MAG: aldehyde ferredoxin oxidoreductase family protein, partial [Halobacteriales archaeon]
VPQLRYLLRVDLSSGAVETEEVPESYRNRFISGKGLGAALLLDETEPGVDPLSPENPLFFVFGPLSGFAPGTSRYAAVTKSPLTGTFVDSYSGGHFPAMARHALPEYLAIQFEGEADEPVYLEIGEDGEAELRDAAHLWGMTTKETARQFEGDRTKTAAIGPAGENQVRFATISSDEGTHHAGRGGTGAVMGAKNLKAVVARGGDPPAETPEIEAAKGDHARRLATSEGIGWARDGGTQLIPEWTQEVGALPSHNWTKGTVEDIEDLAIESFEPAHVAEDSCFGCPVACGHVTDFSETDVDGAFPDASVDWGPEYETIGMMGANTDITDVTGVTELADMADRLGMDTISLGNVISWAMEAAEAGLVDYDIEFGDAHAAKALVEQIVAREGIGDALADGTARAAEQLADGASRGREAAVEVKGMELPAYDPRASVGMGLAYATSDRGACHQRAWPIGTDALGGDRDPLSIEGQADAVVEDQDVNALLFSMITCDFTGYDYEYAAEWLNALGYDVAPGDLETVGERAWNATRLFNVREGFDRDDDTLPERLTEPIEDAGPATGEALERERFETMLEEYYEKRGWRQDGVPKAETLSRLDIADLAPPSVSG